jgi:uncharacterized protein YbcI
VDAVSEIEIEIEDLRRTVAAVSKVYMLAGLEAAIADAERHVVELKHTRDNLVRDLESSSFVLLESIPGVEL